MDPARGVASAVAAAVLFGASAPLAKELLGTIPPLMLAGLLYLGSGLGLSVLLAWRRAQPQSIARSERIYLALAVLSGGVLGPVLLLLGLQQTSAASASLLLNLEGVLTASLAWVVFRENVDRRVFLGMTAIVAGGALLSWQGPLALAPGTPWIALACLCWAIDNNLTQKVSGLDPLRVARLKGMTAGCVNLGLAVALSQLHPVSLGILAAAGLVGLFGYGLSLALFVLGLRQLGTARTAAYFSLAPFVGAALSLAIFGEHPTLRFALAATCMAVGVALHLTEHHEHPHTHEELEHTHEHVHDEHHQHTHGPDDPPGEPHTHWHRHEPLTHTHPHYPDLHHRHDH